MSKPFDFFMPERWDEALALRKRFDKNAVVLAGGTDVMILIKRGIISPKHIISLSRTPSWGSYELNGSVTFNAGTTFRKIEREAALLPAHTALVRAASMVGGVQVRNVATIGGNLCNASPAADSAPPLLAMDAEIVLYGLGGKRTLPIDSFFIGPGSTALNENELLQSITIPEMPKRTATEFLKYGRRSAMEISIASVAARLTMDGKEDICQTARIALGAVAPTPLRVREAEQVLEGQKLTTEILEAAAEIVKRAISPISDVRASAEYRREMCGILVKRVLDRCHVTLTGQPIS